MVRRNAFFCLKTIIAANRAIHKLSLEAPATVDKRRQHGPEAGTL